MSKQQQSYPITMVPLTDIIHSHTNPSGRDEVADLAAGIKAVGLLNPITLRESTTQPGKKDLVCGERRFRAFELNGETEIPAFVRELDDQEALTLQIIENQDREDISPIDEAAQFALLKGNNTLDWLASQINRPVKYISDRLKLNDLITECAEYVRKGIMPLGHGIMIAKLTPADQKRCLDECLEYDDDAEAISMTRSELRHFIEKDLTLDMDRCPFSTSDDTLNPGMTSCDKCPLRTINAQILFSDMIDDDRCTNRPCYDIKLAAHIDRAKTETKKDFDKVVVGAMGHNKREVKVGGKTLQYSETPGKNTTPVVISKTESPYAHSSIGKVVHVVLPAKEEKALAKPKGQVRDYQAEQKGQVRDYQAEQKAEYIDTTYPRLLKAVEFMGNETADFDKLIRKQIYEWLDNVQSDVLVPMIKMLSGYEITAEEAYKSPYTRIEESIKELDKFTIPDLIRLTLFAETIGDDNRIEWSDIEKAAATKAKSTLNDILPKKAAAKPTPKKSAKAPAKKSPSKPAKKK